ncbi:MAG TPA: amino acid permease [Thermoleophilaceae bacterium]
MPKAKVVATKPAYITWVTLAFMTTASVASLRSAPTMAVYGLACVFLYIVPAIIFLIPQALVAAELASGWTGGVFRWVSEGISPRWGLLAVWCQFAMTIFYYPTLLAFVASTLAYVFNPDLADSGVYTGVVIVVVFWLGVFMSARGGTGGIAKLASSGLVVGTLIPGAILVVLGVVYLAQGNDSAAPMNASHLLPEWTGIASLVLIVNNFLSYSGMEMNAVHVSSLRNPGSEFPRAIFFACGLVLAIFILPALAISWVIPAQQLSLTAGVMQAFSAFFAHFNLTWLVPIVAIALVCASAGGMLTWLGGPSKGLLLIARREGYLPPFFQQQNEHEVAVNILVVQGGITTVIAIMYALIPSVSSAYWILSVMTTQVYLVVYLLMFVAAVRLRRDQPNVHRGYLAPALKFLCIMGFCASAAAVIIGFVPPSQFNNGNTVAYVLLILAGTVLIGLLPPYLFLRFRKPSWQLEPAPAGAAVAAATAAPPAPTEAPEAEAPPEPPAPPAPPEPPEPSEPSGHAPEHPSHRWLRWGIGVLALALIVVGLFTYKAGKDNQEAQQKATQLTQLFKQANLPVPVDQDTITKSLGTDGGAVCEDPASALGKAILNGVLTNGAAFVGQRAVIFDTRYLQGEALILKVYCPDKLQAFQDKVNKLKSDNTVKP